MKTIYYVVTLEETPLFVSTFHYMAEATAKSMEVPGKTVKVIPMVPVQTEFEFPSVQEFDEEPTQPGCACRECEFNSCGA